MAEQIEKWREDFIGINKTKRDTSFFEGRFLDDRTEMLFHGFLMAKRNMPVIELPKPEMCFGKKPFAYVHLDKTIAAIEFAGLQYTIKGD